jgi:hypothetical protein
MARDGKGTRCSMKKLPPRKMKLTRESLRLLTAAPADRAWQAVEGGAATRPPVCEMTNFISCLRC